MASYLFQTEFMGYSHPWIVNIWLQICGNLWIQGRFASLNCKYLHNVMGLTWNTKFNNVALNYVHHHICFWGSWCMFSYPPYVWRLPWSVAACTGSSWSLPVSSWWCVQSHHTQAYEIAHWSEDMDNLKTQHINVKMVFGHYCTQEMFTAWNCCCMLRIYTFRGSWRYYCA